MQINEVPQELGRKLVTIFQKINRNRGKMDIVRSQREGRRRIQLDNGAEEKPE